MEPAAREQQRSSDRPERIDRIDRTTRAGRTADAKTIPVVSTSPTTASGMCPRRVVVVHQRLVDCFGEAYLVWRCIDCGAVGDLEAFPSACPDCGASRESLYYYVED